MGKSAVLKDLSNHVSGYVILSGENALCRVQLGAPAMLVLVFSDGTNGEYELAADRMEQCFPCKEKNMCGCYVFQKEQLLLISDEGMRCAFEKRMCKARIDGLGKRISEHDQSKQPLSEAQPEKKTESEQQFPDRRWPPPPCWDAACYRDGRWQEE